jgi:hypothetical protein
VQFLFEIFVRGSYNMHIGLSFYGGDGLALF